MRSLSVENQLFHWGPPSFSVLRDVHADDREELAQARKDIFPRHRGNIRIYFVSKSGVFKTHFWVGIVKPEVSCDSI